MGEAEDQFISEVFPAELKEIRRRRQALGLDCADLQGRPAPQRGLVGLAFSGGGIRSATFCLGVTEALAHHGLLEGVDYLSTVSGGGYTGSCLSSVLNEPHSRLSGPSFPFHHEPGVEEPVAFQHLRNGSNYLAPGGLLDKLRMPALAVRGILLNLLLIMPVIMLAVALTELGYELGHFLDIQFQWIPLLAWGLFAILILSFPLVARAFRGFFGWRGRNRYELLLALGLAVSLLCLAWLPLWLLIAGTGHLNWTTFQEQVWHELRSPFQGGDAWKWFLVIGGCMAFILAGQASERLSRWSGRLLLYGLGLLGPAVLLGIYLLLCVAEIDSPFISKDFQATLNAASLSDELREVLQGRGLELSAGSSVRVETPDERWFIVDGEDEHLIKARGRSLEVETLDIWDGEKDVAFFGAWFLLLLFNTIFIDVNITSPHGFYRDRLSKVYLFRSGPDGSVEPNDTLKLSELNRGGSTAPYHLINTVLNLRGSPNDFDRGRLADFFIFSKRYSGSERTGYCKTKLMERADSHLNLGTAMAISGAAAAPNMGATTIRPLVFVMTLLNIRLGYWLPNPGRVLGGRHRRLLRGVGPLNLFREAVGGLHIDGPHVNVSDGGHLENLGIFELLRRRCRLIVSIDAGADPDHHFSSLVELIRFGRVDLGVDIDIDLADLKMTDGLADRHWTLGTIHYGDNEVGHLLYIKASVTGDENRYVLDYRRRHPDFPHQSTANQFFDEPQFEAYRALGYHAANRTLAELREAGRLEQLIATMGPT